MPGFYSSTRIDHLIYGVPDLAAAADGLERRLGVRPGPGGQHQGRGTHNALLSLGGGVYLEMLAPDPAQPAPRGRRWLGIDDLAAPGLIGWAAATGDLEAIVDEAGRMGVQLGPIREGERIRPDGVRLSWRFTMPRALAADGLLPFFIDWGITPHPSNSSPQGITLAELRAGHPEPVRAADELRRLGLDVQVVRWHTAALFATLHTPRGMVELR